MRWLGERERGRGDSGALYLLLAGGQDRLADPIDVELLLETLPAGMATGRQQPGGHIRNRPCAGVVLYHQRDPDLEHLDYIWAEDARERVFNKVLQLLQNDLQSRAREEEARAAEVE